MGEIQCVSLVAMQCGKNGCFLSPNAFLVKDVEQEKNFSFCLADSLIKARRQSLLEVIRIPFKTGGVPELTSARSTRG